MIYAIGGFLLAILALQVIVLHKVRRIHLATFQLNKAAEETSSLYAQLQAYSDLSQLITPRRPLPPLRNWAASPDLLLVLAQHVLREKPAAILECSSGASTLVLARCCELNGAGHVVSLEHDERFARQTREWLTEQGLESWATVIHAPLVPTGATRQPWYDIDDLTPPSGGFDLLVIDGPPSSLARLARYPALPLLDRFLASGATVFLDDAARPDERDVLQQWREEFPGYEQTLIPLDKGAAVLTKAGVARTPAQQASTAVPDQAGSLPVNS